jgi:hypothetical protein
MIDNNQLKDIWQKALSQMLIVTTSGGKAGEAIWFSTLKGGRIKGTCACDMKRGECLAVFTESGNWWLVDISVAQDNSSSTRTIEYRRCEQHKKITFKVPILFEIQSSEQKNCTCPTYKRIGTKCKEVCDGTGEFKNLSDCLKGNPPGDDPGELAYTILMSISQYPGKKWQRFVFSPNSNPITYYYFGYEGNQIQQYGTGRDVSNTHSVNTSFLFDIINQKPDFPISATWYGNVRFSSEKDLQKLIDSQSILLGSESSNTDPYYRYRNAEIIETASPGYWLIDSYPDGTPADPQHPSGGYFGQYTPGFVDPRFTGGITRNFSIAARVNYEEIGKAIAYLTSAFRSRIDGNLNVDFILKPDWEPKKPTDPPPPTIAYEPPSITKRAFWLGGDRTPQDLEFALTIDDPFEAYLSSVSKQRIITIKHGKKPNQEWCKITAIYEDGEIIKTTFTNPTTPTYPSETWNDWRSDLSHAYGTPPTSIDACVQEYRNNKNANKIGNFIYKIQREDIEPEVKTSSANIELTSVETTIANNQCQNGEEVKHKINVCQLQEGTVTILNVAPLDENQRP